MSLKDAWGKFRRGDSISDQELSNMLQDCEQGIPFLENRGETGGVLYKALMDREALRSYQTARERRKK